MTAVEIFGSGRAITSVGDDQVAICTTRPQQAGPWDIGVEVERSAISIGTESHLVRTTRSDRPRVLGYAPVGRVVWVGENAATRHQPGDRVVYFMPEPNPGSMIHVCGGHQSHAIVHVDPAIRDPLAPDRFCVQVPDDVSSEQAAFAGVAAVASMGATMPRTAPGDRVLVLGQGLIGQFAAQHFRLRGAEVAVCDLSAKRLNISIGSGADHIIDASQRDVVEAVKSIWPNGADIIADTTGLYPVIESTLDALVIRGRYVFLGWCKGKDFSLESFHHQRVFEAFFPWTIEGRHIQHSLRMMAHGGLRVEPLITHRPTIDQAPDIYAAILGGSTDHLGVVFNWDSAGDEVRP